MRIGDHFVADLEALEIVFFGGDEVFAEDAKLLVGEPEDHVGIDPRVVLPRMRLTVSGESLGGDEDLELARGVFVLGARRLRTTQARDGQQHRGSPPTPCSEEIGAAHASHDVSSHYAQTIAVLRGKCEFIRRRIRLDLEHKQSWNVVWVMQP